MRIGLVSDTHGLLDPALPPLLEGCDLILHAGDVDAEPVLAGLSRIAPVRAARGNNDHGPFGDSLPESFCVELAGVRVLVIHEARADAPAAALRRSLSRWPADLVVHGHSHRPGSVWRGPTLFLNPGSAGPRRFSLPRTASVLVVEERRLEVRWYELAPGGARQRAAPLAVDLDASPHKDPR